MLPEWLLTEDDYVPKKDKDNFIQKSIVGLFSVLTRLRTVNNKRMTKLEPTIAIVLAILLIISISVSDNAIFLFIVLGILLVRVALFPAKHVRKIIVPAFFAAIFSAVIMLPAFLLGSPYVFYRVSFKVFMSVIIVNILSNTYMQNQLTRALKKLHVPSLFIMTLDLTIKYIVILGDISLNMLVALKLRSVGRNDKKRSSAAGILGSTFLKSKELAEETYEAMICRGYDGEYK